MNEPRTFAVNRLGWRHFDNPPADELGSDPGRVGHTRELFGGEERFGDRRRHVVHMVTAPPAVRSERCQGVAAFRTSTRPQRSPSLTLRVLIATVIAPGLRTRDSGLRTRDSRWRAALTWNAVDSTV